MTLEYVVKIPLLNCFDKRSPFFNEERILYGIEVRKNEKLQTKMIFLSLKVFFVLFFGIEHINLL